MKHARQIALTEKPIFLTKADIILSFEGQVLKLTSPIYRNINRYFVPFFNLLRAIKCKYKSIGNKIYITLKNKTYILNQDHPKYKFTRINNELYISLLDTINLLDLKTRWEYKKNEISLYINRDKITSPPYITPGKLALIRFEDVTAGGEYLDADNLEKMRIIADFLFLKSVPFHIAWIPRYIDPPNHMDNDISKSYTIANADFLFTLEYMLSRNGLIGLHGYTHQYGEETTTAGTEFNEERNNDEESIRTRLTLAIETAKKLEITYSFFENPHYAATAFQQSIQEQYFDYIYEGYVGIWGTKIVTSPRNNNTLYIPTPLGYVSGDKGTEEMIKRINTLSKNSLASLFYHPTLEMKFITLLEIENGDGYPYYDYSEASTLHQILMTLNATGHTLSTITKLKTYSI
jgi:hypothetical protein